MGGVACRGECGTKKGIGDLTMQIGRGSGAVMYMRPSRVQVPKRFILSPNTLAMVFKARKSLEETPKRKQKGVCHLGGGDGPTGKWGDLNLL